MAEMTDTIFLNVSDDFKAGVRLLCLPNAGGSAALFHKWPQHLPPQIGISPAVLPGQGTRLREQPPAQIAPLVRELYEGMTSFLDEPYALFGYSMGALITFELLRLLRREGRALPVHLFVAARRAPQRPETNPPLHLLPDSLFMKGIQSRYGGIPEAIMQDAELTALFRPVLRANFAMIETYQYHSEDPFDMPITVFGGTQDRTTPYDELNAWQVQTQAHFQEHMFEGDHFFLQQHTEAITGIITTCLQPFITSR